MIDDSLPDWSAWSAPNRLPRLDMKRAAILVIGLAVLIPFMVGVVTGVRPVDFDSTRLAPRLTGVVPEFLSYYVVEAIHPARVPLVRRGGEEVDWIELPPS